MEFVLAWCGQRVRTRQHHDCKDRCILMFFVNLSRWRAKDVCVFEMAQATCEVGANSLSAEYVVQQCSSAGLYSNARKYSNQDIAG